jgi:hypothetical protein
MPAAVRPVLPIVAELVFAEFPRKGSREKRKKIDRRVGHRSAGV